MEFILKIDIIFFSKFLNIIDKCKVLLGRAKGCTGKGNNENGERGKDRKEIKGVKQRKRVALERRERQTEKEKRKRIEKGW